MPRHASVPKTCSGHKGEHRLRPGKEDPCLGEGVTGLLGRPAGQKGHLCTRGSCLEEAAQGCTCEMKGGTVQAQGLAGAKGEVGEGKRVSTGCRARRGWA